MVNAIAQGIVTPSTKKKKPPMAVSSFWACHRRGRFLAPVSDYTDASAGDILGRINPPCGKSHVLRTFDFDAAFAANGG